MSGCGSCVSWLGRGCSGVRLFWGLCVAITTTFADEQDLGGYSSPDVTKVDSVQSESIGSVSFVGNETDGLGRSKFKGMPLDYSSIGLHLSFFHYHETFPYDQLLVDYGVQRIEGEPKSSEYGISEGVRLRGIRHVNSRDMFLRLDLDGTLGLLHRYDGSTQPQIVDDSTGMVAIFYPAEGTKNNYFLRLGACLGVGPLRQRHGISIWSGMGARLWKRALWGDTEYYYWFTLPIGLWGYHTLRKAWVVGMEIVVDFMLAGWMKLVLDDSKTDGEYHDVPPVRLSYGTPLGKRASVSLSLPMMWGTKSNVAVALTPSFEYYHFERSATACLDGDCTEGSGRWFYEPASRTVVGGILFEIIIVRDR